MLETDPFLSQSSGEPLTNDLILKSKAVVNGALGFRHKFSDTLSGYLSAATDFTSIDTTNSVSVGRTPWDLYHFGGGAKLTINRLQLVLGGAYASGGTDIETDSVAGLPLLQATTVNVTERGFRFLIGFEFGFGKDGDAEAGAGADPGTAPPNDAGS
ncbi:MAG: hypothetical protein FD129_1693 [bacterium]|nr:MAG: hypothetical protein FD129_1693 [bacterium]